jgi:hypothetical protein
VEHECLSTHKNRAGYRHSGEKHTGFTNKIYILTADLRGQIPGRPGHILTVMPFGQNEIIPSNITDEQFKIDEYPAKLPIRKNKYPFAKRMYPLFDEVGRTKCLRPSA